MTHQVVTRWYRAPELLFGSRIYATGIDMWAVGCILAELLKRDAFLTGETDLNQLVRIFDLFGTPNENNWPDVKTLPDYVEFKPQYPKPLKIMFSAASNDVLNVLDSMLTLNPSKRCTCREALMMPYFSNAPGPTPIAELPAPTSIAEQAKKDAAKNVKRKTADEASGL